jgi:virulence factor Mce-like protein
MKRRRDKPALTASPVLIGAVTVLIAIVAVFISYNANQGLPFVPTYDVKVVLPNGNKLTEGNDVRAGGFRVGSVERIRSVRRSVDGEQRAVAELSLKLDKRLDPLPTDTTVAVRSRSALGLKYLELTPGGGESGLRAGGTLPLEQAADQSVELEDVLSTFDAQTRRSAQLSLKGFGDSLAGRGPDLNVAIGDFNPLLRHLTPVMRSLSDPRTELSRLVPALGRTAAEVAPVAGVQAQWLAHMADTFEAVGRDPRALRETIEESPPTLAAATRSFAVQTPFLARFATLSRELEPGTAELRRALPAINGALAAGVPAFERTPELSERVEGVFGALEQLGDEPVSLIALQDLRMALQLTRPGLELIAPYQTVCNYLVYFFNPLGTHQSTVVAGGNTERILVKLALSGQANNLATTESTRPVDVPDGQDPQGPGVPAPQALHTQYGGPAIDRQGRADCQSGQTGYPFKLTTDARYKGGHTALDADTPGSAGGTFKARELGVDGVEDVP